jgi:HSP20 family molecular chaperone IbpA
MTKLTLGSHPFLLGFDQLERLVERTAKSGNDGYPPYNIEQRGENAYRITLAVAGFAEGDLSITVEDKQLVVRGKQSEDDGERVFLHRGIAARQFQRSFVMADGVEVAGASMEHGLLHIDLRRAVPDSVVQTIKINDRRGLVMTERNSVPRAEPSHRLYPRDRGGGPARRSSRAGGRSRDALRHRVGRRAATGACG